MMVKEEKKILVSSWFEIHDSTIMLTLTQNQDIY